MAAVFKSAWGYQGNNMALPVADLEAAIPFYETVMGFRIVSRAAVPHSSAVLARDEVQMGLVENGGDATQDGCAFEVDDAESAFAELQANGLGKKASEFGIEQHDGTSWKVFYVVAPDGLCYWFGQRVTLAQVGFQTGGEEAL
jgi:lactoylglutathione lyase